MTFPGRNNPLSSGAVRTAGRQNRSASSAIVGTAVVAILAVLVIVLSYRIGHHPASASLSDLSAVEAHVDELNGELRTLQRTVRTLAKKTGTPAAAGATRTSKTLSTCLTQVQREIDDLQAYLAYRTPPRRDRVSGSCRTLLRPRFGS